MRAGIDGEVPVGTIAATGCCPPPVCEINPDSLACSAISLLPTGPLWDSTKQQGIGCVKDCTDGCAIQPFGNENEVCTSLVAHAIYTGRKLYYYVIGALWPALREDDPDTAFTTMDEWLDRLGWVDCYNQFCRDPALGEMTPYEILGECGIEYCPPTFSPELTLVYKRGIIRALSRLRRGIIPNLAALNFVLEPLYARVELDPDYDPVNNPQVQKCLILGSTATHAPVVTKDPCPRTETNVLQSQKTVPLFITPGNGLCAGGASVAYPLVLAAHCIARSLLPSCCIVCLRREDLLPNPA
jgi:hypothetical protein